MLDESLFINRELSWLNFNRRVLEEANRPENPLLERCNFLGITASNLDEFYMVRVAGVKQQVAANYTQTDPSGMTPKAQLKAIALSAHDFAQAQYDCAQSLTELLRREHVEILPADGLEGEDQAYIRKFYKEQIFPVLTPMALDLERPLPYLSGRKLYIALRLVPRKKDKSKPELALPRVAVVPVPGNLSRWIALPEISGHPHRFVMLEDVMGGMLPKLFDKYKVGGTLLMRLTRDGDLTIDDDAEDLMSEIEKSIKKRRWGSPVRLEWSLPFGKGPDPWLLEYVIAKLGMRKRDLYPQPGLLDLTAFSKLSDHVEEPAMRYPKRPPRPVAEFASGENIFEVIARQPVLVHHPYQSFDPVLSLLREAAADPQVLAIKQTLYRVSRHSPVIGALVDAANAGKQVTVLVELKARFDEENNIGWARVLERAGCHVIYGLAGLKVHCKLLLVVRREGDTLRRYLHLGTGNYNDATARFYTDMGLFTASAQFGEDATGLFNFITGYSKFPHLKRLHAAPDELRGFLYRRIDAEIENARQGRPARIIAKVNSLLDPGMIERLYQASQAGVRIDLIVRGICSLRPGIPGVSDRIRVISIVGRYLEHHRIFYFENGGQEKVYLSSADWMPRNLDRRVETCFPLDDEAHKRRVVDLLHAALADNQSAREMTADGGYHPVPCPDGAAPLDFQTWCYQRLTASDQAPSTDKLPLVPRDPGESREVSPAACFPGHAQNGLAQPEAAAAPVEPPVISPQPGSDGT
jgi:polyphosphate kinase